MDAQIQRVPSALAARVLSVVDEHHLLPAPYTYAFAYILYQATSYTSYLFGVVYPHAVWFYFPVSMLVKSSLTFLVLLVGCAWALISRNLRLSRGVLYTVIAAAVYLLFSMRGGMNIGIRHILPVYVFLAVPLAGAAWALVERNRRWLSVVAVLLVFQAMSALRAFPGYISYVNEAFGGPANAYKWVGDSSADWGQQLKSVKRYLDGRGVGNHGPQRESGARRASRVAGLHPEDPRHDGVRCAVLGASRSRGRGSAGDQAGDLVKPGPRTRPSRLPLRMATEP
jgi:hypothetical protein